MVTDGEVGKLELSLFSKFPDLFGNATIIFVRHVLMSQNKIIVIPRFVCLYEEIIYEL